MPDPMPDDRVEEGAGFIEARCPKCRACLLSDGVAVVCSMVGCDYGVYETVPAPSEHMKDA